MSARFPEFQHHICFVSAQNVAELLGALLSGGQKPRIHAIVTSEMVKQATWLEAVCHKQGLEFSSYPLPRTGMAAVVALLNGICADCGDGAWAVNITGGTKLMAFGAYAWAVKNNVAAFYVDTAGKSVELYDQGRWRTLPLPDMLGYEPLLNLYGYEIRGVVNNYVPRRLYGVLRDLAGLAAGDEGGSAFHKLNELALAASADSQLTAPCAPNGRLIKVLEVCRGAGKLDWGAGKVRFRDERSRKWCNGIWLEEYVKTVLASLQDEGRIYSWASGLELKGQGADNELDAVFTANNRLHVLECKTFRLTGAARAASIIYKADSVRGRVGGIFAKSMLCALDVLSPRQSQRAADLGVKTVFGSELGNLRDILIEWMEA